MFDTRKMTLRSSGPLPSQRTLFSALGLLCLSVGVGCASTSTANRRAPISAQDRQAAALAADPAWRSALKERATELLAQASFGSDPMLRANAIEGLQQAPDKIEAVARAGLTDENLGVRFAAAMTIGKLKLADSTVFVDPLLKDPSKIVRAAAIYALRRNNVQADPTPLASMLDSDKATERAQAAFILGELGDGSAIALLRSSARRSSPLASPIEDRLVRLQIAEALVKLGDLEAIETIRASLFPSRPEDLELTALAVQIIGNVDDRRSLDQLIYLTGRTGQNRLPAEIRLAAAQSLAKLGNRRGAFIADEYRQDANPAIRAQSAFVLGATDDPANLEKLDLLMSDPVGFVQVAAAAAALQSSQRSDRTANADAQR